MSHTDSTAPWWTSAEPRAVHTRACCQQQVACTLPARPAGRAIASTARWAPHDPTACCWVTDRSWRPGNPPAWYRHLTWTGPQRAAVRDQCRRALVEHRATGTVDTLLTTDAHRHDALWHWT